MCEKQQGVTLLCGGECTIYPGRKGEALCNVMWEVFIDNATMASTHKKGIIMYKLVAYLSSIQHKNKDSS
jgi:hypothetical protein